MLPAPLPSALALFFIGRFRRPPEERRELGGDWLPAARALLVVRAHAGRGGEGGGGERRGVVTWEGAAILARSRSSARQQGRSRGGGGGQSGPATVVGGACTLLRRPGTRGPVADEPLHARGGGKRQGPVARSPLHTLAHLRGGYRALLPAHQGGVELSCTLTGGAEPRGTLSHTHGVAEPLLHTHHEGGAQRRCTSALAHSRGRGTASRAAAT